MVFLKLLTRLIFRCCFIVSNFLSVYALLIYFLGLPSMCEEGTGRSKIILKDLVSIQCIYDQSRETSKLIAYTSVDLEVFLI